MINTRKLATLSILTALALIIFIIELLIPNPIPIPGVKLGLANIITIYAVYRYRPVEAVLILAARILLGALLSGNFLALQFSLAGGALCLAGMIALRPVIGIKHIWLSSILGAVFHNIGQLTAAVLITKTTAVIAYLPVLLVSGCIAGLFTGLCAQAIIRRLSGRAGRM